MLLGSEITLLISPAFLPPSTHLFISWVLGKLLPDLHGDCHRGTDFPVGVDTSKATSIWSRVFGNQRDDVLELVNFT